MGYAKRMLDIHPRKHGLDAGVLGGTIEVLADCAQTCTACADACLGEEQVDELVGCIRLDLDCADVCAATLRVLSRQTQRDAELARGQLEACATACRRCAEECDRHAARHEHCRVCAEACRRCEQACAQLLATM